MNDHQANQRETLETMSVQELFRGALGLDIPEFRHSCFAEIMRRLDEDHPDAVVPMSLRELYHLDNTNRYELEQLILLPRDKARWFCAASDEDYIPRVHAHGDSEQEARQRAEQAAAKYRDAKAEYRVMAPLAEWTFKTYAPEED
jgi:aspartyl-tRNA synthetase